MSKWKDRTSYSRNEDLVSERVPRTWEIESPYLRIIVSRWIHGPGSWFLTCEAVECDRLDLNTDSAALAKTLALALVSARLTEMASSAAQMLKDEEAG